VIDFNINALRLIRDSQFTSTLGEARRGPFRK
jgi:hypothetical protein